MRELFAFKKNKIDSEKKILFTITFLKGKTEDWIKPKKKTFL